MDKNKGLRDNPLVNKVTLKSWKEIIELEDSFGKTWMFRGHSDDWGLVSSLHRTCDRFKKDDSEDYSEAFKIESALMRDFRRSYVGADSHDVLNDPMYCLAKMQHYGAPTRLLDWTYSFFVALYFAMEGATTKKSAYIWAFNYEWTKGKLKSLGLSTWKYRNVDESRGNPALFEDEYFVKANRMIFIEGAMPLNSRLADQQGVFLLPGIVSEPIDAIFNYQLDDKDALCIIELKLGNEEFSKVLNKLYRMRMTYKSIYADSTWHGRDLILKIPALSIRNDRIVGGEFSEPNSDDSST